MVDFVVEFIADFIAGILEWITAPWAAKMHRKWKGRKR